MSRIYSASIPPVSAAFFDELDKAFRLEEITPTSDINEIMFNAGQRKVVDWVRMHIQKSTINGVENITPRP